MIGASLGPYKIIEQLGAGGMREVYLGEDTRLGRKVAIKVLPEKYGSCIRQIKNDLLLILHGRSQREGHLSAHWLTVRVE